MQTLPVAHENYLREILFIFFAQKTLITRIALLIFIGVLCIAFLSPPVYTAKSTLLVKGKRVERNPEILTPTDERMQPISKVDLNSEITTLTSESVLRDTIIKLQDEPNIFNIAAEDRVSDPDVSVMELISKDNSLSKALKKLQSAIDVGNSPSSNTIDVSVQWASSEAAKQILDALLDSYFMYRSSVYKPEQTRVFYNDTVADYQAAINQKHQEKLDLIQRIKANDALKEIDSNLGLIKEYQQQLTQLQREQITIQGEQDFLTEQLKIKQIHTFPSIENPSVREQALVVQQMQAKYAQVSKNYLPESLMLRSTEKELASAFKNLKQEVESLQIHQKAKLKSMAKDVHYLEAKIEQLIQRNLELAKLDVELKKIQRDSDLLELAFTNYYKLREEATMQSKTQSANLHTQVIILTPPWADKKATFPNKRFMLPFGFVIALLVGLTAGFIREYFDHTFKRSDDSMRYLGVPSVLSLTPIKEV